MKKQQKTSKIMQIVIVLISLLLVFNYYKTKACSLGFYVANDKLYYSGDDNRGRYMIVYYDIKTGEIIAKYVEDEGFGGDFVCR